MKSFRRGIYKFCAFFFFPCMLLQADPSVDDIADTVTIEIGNLASYEDSEDWLNKEISLFEKAHPNIRVSRTSFTEPFRESVPLHAGAPFPRNIIGIDSRMGGEIPYLVGRGDLVPVEQFLPDPGFNEDAYSKNLWDAVTYDGKRWGVPWQSWGDVMVLDWELFQKAGIAEPPKTWDEFIEVTKTLTKPESSNGEPPQWGLRVSTRDDTAQTLAMTMVFQLGGTVMKDNQFHLDTPELERAVNLLRDLNAILKVSNVDRRRIAEVANDHSVRYAIQFEYINRLGPILSNDRFRLAPIPSFSGESVNSCPRRLHFAIRKASPAEQDASWELIKWLTRAEISLPNPTNCFPVRRDVLEHPQFKARAASGIKGLESIVEVIQHGRDLGGFAQDRIHGFDTFWDAFTPVLMGVKDFKEVVQRAEDSANRKITPSQLPNTSSDLY